MTSIQSSSVAMFSCFLSWETSPMRPWLPISPFIFGIQFSCPRNIILSFRWFLYHFFSKCETTHPGFLSVHVLRYQLSYQKNSWRRTSRILFRPQVRWGTLKMNTTVLDWRLPAMIIGTESTHHWNLLIELHSSSIAASGLSSPLVQWTLISIAQIFLFSPSNINGCKLTMQIHLKAGSTSSYLTYFTHWRWYHSIPAIIDTGKAHGAQPEDIYGCLYFFLSTQLRTFAARLRGFSSSFTVVPMDARKLPGLIRENEFAEFNIPWHMVANLWVKWWPQTF